ncbi:gluconokinase [Nesterenkonia xinjiangensis]|uniref:Gluconokinase n=1 Tax=Nesterenkonia xinjiangensis TaxID=225327 RepID=A0A7Z0GP59_9MICC|nr:FGGY-family carbohydrate kinase [Nesterenkonia xinjiangensis]NYJ79510.1 gluconokinase [Nesterenkonia xinjiangensis]
MLILALEASTTSAKTMLFDTETQEVTVRTRRFVIGGEDPAVREAEGIFVQLVQLGAEAAAGRAVDMIALSGTWHGMTLREPDLAPITAVQEWPYTGAQDLCAQLREDQEFTRWFYVRTGCMVNASYPAFKLMLLRRQGMQVAGGLVLDQNSYTFARLTGRVWTSYSQASGTGLLSTAEDDWDREVISRLGLDGILLPELHHGEETAPLTREAASMLGVAAGTPVVLPGPDGGLNQVGEDATTPGEMTFSMGTSGALRCAVEAPSLSPQMSTWAYRSPTGWLSGAATSGCTNCVDWAKDQLFGGSTTYNQLEPMLSTRERDMPLFMPFLFGERCPGWQDQRRGGFLDLHPSHGKEDLYQSVLHGVTFSLYHCYRELIALNGEPERIILSGGVLSSPFWTQLTADVFGVEMELSALQHSSTVGAVKMALRAAGLPAAQPALTDSHRASVVPELTRSRRYAAEFERYLEGYARTSPDQDVRGGLR